MKIQSDKLKNLLDVSGAILVLIILLFYTYVYLYKIPYLGFDFVLGSGKVTHITTQNYPPNALTEGDIILKVGKSSWSDYMARLPGTSLEPYLAKNRVELTVSHAGQTIQLDWTTPNQNWVEISHRIFSSIWLLLPYSFWLAGAITLLNVRPRDQRRNLLVAFDFLIAIWTITGYQSSWDYYSSSDVFHTAIWIFWPVSWHLHWIFPQPIRRLNPWIWIALYATTCAGAIVDYARILNFNLYPIPMILAASGSLIILGLHYFIQPQFRRQVLIVLVSLTIAVLPGMVRVLASMVELPPGPSEDIAYWSLIILSIAYLYAIYYHQSGSLELRASSVLSLLFYTVFVFLVCYATIFLLAFKAHRLTTSTTTILIVALQTALVTAIFYPTIRRWIEHYLLGMPLAPQNILTTYTSQIITTRDTEHLAKLICEQILPSLMIRQAALLQIHSLEGQQSDSEFETIFRLNISDEQMPTPAELPGLVSQAGHYISSSTNLTEAGTAWVRLPLIKTINPDVLILLLLGQRDPDDYYAQNELKILQALVDNTALALINIEQNRLLHNLYQADIERQEQERTRLALDLHDDVLNQLALLVQSMNETGENAEFFQTYQASVQRVREIISGLRPPLLNYGLGAALMGLPDEVIPQTENGFNMQIEIPPTTNRYPAEVELHLFRMVQQACANAIRHSHAQNLSVTGELDVAQVTLEIEDDGIGFDHLGQIDLDWLLANKHFGLAGMFERAALINAHLQVDTKPDHGTRVRIGWNAPARAQTYG